MQRVSSLVEIYSLVHFRGNRRSYKTLKNVKPSQTSALLSQSTVEKEMSFTDELFKFALLLFTMTINTKHSFISSASCPHTERNSWKNHWDPETSICGHATTGESCYTLVYHKLYAAL